MKIRYILASIVTLFILAVGCTLEPEFNHLKEIKVSQSFVGLPLEGGSNKILLTATGDWTITTEKGGSLPDWLSVSPLNGSAVEDAAISFQADESASNREVVLHITVADKVQKLIVKQASADNELIVCTVKEALATAEGKTVNVRGTITKIENTLYGNWYLTDETGSIYVYGTLDKNGQEKNFASLGLAVGDEVLVQGPRTSYKGKPQLKNVTVLEVKKSLLSTDITEYKIEDNKGVDIPVNVKCIDGGLEIGQPTESWLSVKGVESKGEGKYVVTLTCPDNNSMTPRSASISFMYKGDVEVAPVSVTVKQGALTPEASTIADAIKMDKGTFVNVKGIIVAEGSDSYVVRDETAAILVYKGKHSPRFRDKIQVVGAVDSYNKGPQIAEPASEIKDGYVKTYDHGEAMVIDGPAADKYVQETKFVEIRYVELVGKVQTGKYYNLIFEGAEKAQGSFYRLSDYQKKKVDPLNGKMAKVRGYVTSISSGKFLNFMMCTIEEVK